MSDALPPEAVGHYARGLESSRLLRPGGRLELLRTRELVARFLPGPAATVLDVGGGAGIHALWLASLGYTVHLVDAMPLHVEEARRASAMQPDHPLASAAVGDARRLEEADASVDAVLLLGPLYHLTERADRVAALAEARRVVRPGGVVLAAAISRFASALDGLRLGYLHDPVFQEIVERDLVDGQHRNPSDHPAYFTTAFFHDPRELAAEIADAGLRHESTVAVEGPAWLMAGLEAEWESADRGERLLSTVRALEAEPTLLGASAHLFAAARRD